VSSFPCGPIGVALLAGSSLTACAVDPEAPRLEDLAFQCPLTGCGDNSPLMDGISIAEAHEDDQVANDEGVRVLGLRKGNVHYDLKVMDDRLEGWIDGVPRLTGFELQGSVIRLLQDGNPPRQFFVHIVDVHHSLTFQVGKGDPIWTYRLVWTDNPAMVCTPSGCPAVCPLITSEEGWDEPHVEAIFFEGDRYDRRNRTVSAIEDEAGTEWFNVACIGSTPAKMHVFRFTTVASYLTYQSEQLDRTAVLKMFGGDYCGRGKAFTVIGTAVKWQNAPGWRNLYKGFPPIDDEAVWDENGAVCLDVPRMGDDEDLAEEWMDAIQAECLDAMHPLPTCSGQKWFPRTWTEWGYVRTANPPP
jgi:hypothetical protein